MQKIANRDTALWRLCGKVVSFNATGARCFLLNGWGIFCLILVLANCSTANLVPEERRQDFKPVAEEFSIQHLRQEVFRNIDPYQRYQKGTTLRVTASDIWESTFVRLLTPLDQNVQKFRAELKLYHQGIEYMFLNGEKEGQTIGFDGRSYRYVETEKAYEESVSISLYLDPLQSYFEWHQTLLHSPTVEVIGTNRIEDVQYLVFYVTEGPMQALDMYDQYLLYIDAESNRIDYIEFTMRKLMKSYKGVVHYKNFKKVQGILLPFWIGIADDLLQPKFDHYIVVESASFISFDEELSR
jgi:hypothetical protein